VADVGIVGAGTAGLHLALLLQQHGLEPTLYAERSSEDVRTGRLPNTVVHNYRTRAREREIGANLWDETGTPVEGHWHQIPIGPGQFIQFPGYFAEPSLSVDYRLYQPGLLQAFEERGGTVEIGAIDNAGLAGLSGRHDLVVVSAGRAGLNELFPPVAGRSPFSAPARLLHAGLYTGIRDSGAPHHVVLSLLGPVGEIINIPMLTAQGMLEVLLFECIPGGPLEEVARTPWADDPQAHDRLVLQKIREFSPHVAERVDEASFGVVDATSVLQGAIVPTVRAGYTKLDGAFAIAVGDAHVVVDPVVGLGANAASIGAFALGHTILEGGPFDEAFCQRVDERRLPDVLAHFDFTAAMLQPPPPHVLEVFGAMSQSRELADDFTENFTIPQRQLENLATPESAAAYLGRFAG
jgi:2-polyprenyl-6-methoxyphenol hydroxylase-like FAD-dependent oxidoreductase